MYRFYQSRVLRRYSGQQASLRQCSRSSVSGLDCTTSGITGRKSGPTRSTRYVLHSTCHCMRTNALLKAKYVYHVQGSGGHGESDMIDPVVMSFFLAVPVASMLWAVLCFAVALAAFCVQGTDSNRRIVLVVVIATGVAASLLASLGFKHTWSPRVFTAFSARGPTNIALSV